MLCIFTVVKRSNGYSQNGLLTCCGIEVLPKLVVPSDIRPSKTGNYQKIIYWGDIAGRTKSFIEFRSCIEQLRKKRTDFIVWVPLLKGSNQFLKHDWVVNNNSINKRT